jgi:putative hydrolase of the HAD superfamily
MKLVIFDLDDTLVNFAATREVAYGEMARLLDGEGVDSKAFIQACVQVDRPLFLQFERGVLTRQQYRERRFADPFGLIGVAPAGDIVPRLNKLFMDCVNDSPLLYDDVRPVLAALRGQGVQTAILTNGPSDGQRRKLKATGLDAAVDHVAIGEEAGVSKPMARAFHNVVERFAMKADEVLMVGDSPELDYDGAVSAGLQALLLDRDARHADGSRPTIRSLREIRPA